MADLLDTVVEAHGGLERWNELESVTAHLAQGSIIGPKAVLVIPRPGSAKEARRYLGERGTKVPLRRYFSLCQRI